MKFHPQLKTMLIALLLATVLNAAAFAQDGRINEVWHFGGDVLYCNAEDGCTLVNMQGEFLWNVPQADIDAAMAVACETRQSQFIEAGEGTYGPSILSVHCYEGYEPSLTLSAFDEWGASSSLDFGPEYIPVGPAVSHPDTDGDGIPDSEDACPNVGDLGLGLAPNGCPIRRA